MAVAASIPSARHRVAALALGLLAACGGSSTATPGTPGPTPTTVAKTPGSSGDTQVGVQGTQLASPLSVTVTDGASNPVQGITVSWAVATGGGSVSAPSSVTTASGVATINATLGTLGGSNSFTATVTGLTGSPLTFSATAAKVIAKTSGDGQTGLPGTQLPSPLSVTVTDGASHSVQGITVSWAVATGGGSVSAPTSVTDASGIATINATLGSAGGANSFTATVAGLTGSPLTFSATGDVPFEFGATATLIVGGARAGQIFIAGGNTQISGGGTTAQSSWFYAPATGALTPGPALAFPRAFHTATAVGGGQVLLAGGSGGVGFRTFELCSLDAVSSCTATGGSLATARCSAAAALVGASPARVLVAGGNDCAGGAAMTDWVLWDAGTPTAPVASGAGNRLTTGRSSLTATALGAGKVVLVGGSAALATADLFTLSAATPASSTVAAAGAMIAARTGHSATLLGAGVTTACPTGGPCVLVAGGSSGAAGQSWEIYDASTNTFPVHASAGHDLVVPLRFGHAAAAFSNGKVLLAGGSTDGLAALSSTESFDPSAVTLGFTASSSLTLARFLAASAYAPSQDLLTLAGGNGGSPVSEQAVAP